MLKFGMRLHICIRYTICTICRYSSVNTDATGWIVKHKTSKELPLCVDIIMINYNNNYNHLTLTNKQRQPTLKPLNIKLLQHCFTYYYLKNTATATICNVFYRIFTKS